MRIRRRTKKIVGGLLAVSLLLVLSLSFPPVRAWLKSLIQPPPRHLEPLADDIVIDHSLKLKKDLYPKHRALAEKHKLQLMMDEKDIDTGLLSGQLVKVKAGPGYEIDHLTHSAPVLRHEAYQMLQLIGRLYQKEAGKKQHLTITSLTRTMETQKKLARTNPNATKDISTHCYGMSLDISYVRFNGVKSFDAKRKKTLSIILANLQKQGKIYVTEEKRVACYHITARW